MVWGKKVRIIIILCCVGLTIWQLPNLVYLWRQYHSAKLIQRGSVLGLPSASLPIFPPHVEQIDAEAADVANFLLSSDTDVNESADLVLKYPKNNLLIYKLINEVLSTDGLDPKIADLLADNRLESQPENAHFHYLKAYVQMHTTPPSDFEKVLEIIEEGNKCEILSFPHYMYHNRILALFEKANLNPTYFNIRLLPYEFLHQRQLARRLDKQAIQAFTSGERDYGLRILNAGSGMSKKYFDNSRSYVELVVGTNTLRSIKRTELQYAGLSPNEARDVRYHLSNLKTCLDIVWEKKLEHERQRNILALLIAIGMLACWLTVSIFLLCLIVSIINLIRRTDKASKVGWSAYILFFVCLLFFLVVIAVIALFTDERMRFVMFGGQAETNLYLPLSFMGVSVFLWLTFWLMSLLKSHRIFSFKITRITTLISIAFGIAMIIGLNITNEQDFSLKRELGFFLYSLVTSAVLWVILILGWWIIRQIPYRWLTKNRIIQLLLTVTFFTGIFVLLYIVWLKLILSVLLIASISLIIFHPPSEKLPSLVAGWIQFFSKSKRIAATRQKILSLLSPYLIAFFFCFLISVHFGSNVIREQMLIAKDELADFGPLPKPNQHTYNNMVNKIITDSFDSDYIGYLHMIEPNDLIRVLSAMKDSEPCRLDDRRLGYYVKHSAPDVQNIFLDFFEDPNSEDVLICRAKVGDRTVKAELLSILNQKWAALEDSGGDVEHWNNYWDRPRLGDCFRIAGALAFMSEPNESLERFLDLVENSDLTRMQKGTFLSETLNFYDSLNDLPGKHATSVLKAYLNKTDYSDLRVGREFYALRKTFSQFADADIAEDVLRIMCNTSLIGKPPDISIKGQTLEIQKAVDKMFSPEDEAPEFRISIAPHFNEGSAPILKEALESTNENLRAYAVWQLTRIGYKWPKEDLDRLTQDKSWKVRANIVLAPDSERAAFMQNDSNNLVKLIAKISLAERMQP